MENLKRKLSSRKLWAAVAGLIAGLAMVFGLDEGIITDVSGMVMALGSLVIYVVTEGKIDAAAVKASAEAAQDALEDAE